MTTQSDWNPERAGEEMAFLFNEADQIISQPHYQEDASADEVQNPSADSLRTTEINPSIQE